MRFEDSPDFRWETEWICLECGDHNTNVLTGDEPPAENTTYTQPCPSCDTPAQQMPINLKGPGEW